MTTNKKHALLWLIIPFVISIIAFIVAFFIFVINSTPFSDVSVIPFPFFVPYIIVTALCIIPCVIGAVMGIKLLVRDANVQHSTHTEHGYAGFWKRFVAALIDGIIVTIATLILSLIIGKVSVIAGWLYFILMESSEYQATLGKMILKIKVIDTHGNRITAKRAAFRYFSKYLSQLSFYAGYIMTAFTRRKQAMHDMITDTLVINK